MMQAKGISSTPPLTDPIFADIRAHASAWVDVQTTLDDRTVDKATQLNLEEARVAFSDLVVTSRQLAQARFTTLRGGIVLLRYLSTALLTPGAPSLPVEIATLDMNWETAFGATCAAVADSLAALATRLEIVDGVAEAIVSAAPIFGDFGMARTAARAAIEAFANAGQ